MLIEHVVDKATKGLTDCQVSVSGSGSDSDIVLLAYAL